MTETPPYVVATSGVASATTLAKQYILPAHEVNDILMLFVECSATGGVEAPTGWSNAPGSPRAQGNNVTTINAFWKRATSSSEPNPTVPGSTNHQMGYSTVIRNVSEDADPFDPSASATNGSPNTAPLLAMGTASVTNPLVVALFVSSNDNQSVSQFGPIDNSTLTSVTLVKWAGTTTGNGGSINFVTGLKAAGGALGTFTSTHTGLWVALGFALKPKAEPVIPSGINFNTIVSGVKKTSTAYVIVGGVKKTVATQSVIVSGQKRPVP